MKKMGMLLGLLLVACEPVSTQWNQPKEKPSSSQPVATAPLETPSEPAAELEQMVMPLNILQQINALQNPEQMKKMASDFAQRADSAEPKESEQSENNVPVLEEVFSVLQQSVAKKSDPSNFVNQGDFDRETELKKSE